MKSIFLTLLLLPSLALYFPPCLEPQINTVFLQDTVTDHYFTDRFEAGKIILTDNTEKAGFVKFSGGVSFRATEKAKTEQINIDDVLSFTVQGNCYLVAYDLKYRLKKNDEMDRDATTSVLKCLAIGRASLYVMLARVTNNSGAFFYNPNFYIKKGADGYLLIPANKKKFKDLVSPLFQDDNTIRDAIDNGMYTYENLDQLVSDYNARHKNDE